eukprot:1372132-Amphidinium_carterae.1
MDSTLPLQVASSASNRRATKSVEAMCAASPLVRALTVFVLRNKRPLGYKEVPTLIFNTPQGADSDV